MTIIHKKWTSGSGIECNFISIVKILKKSLRTGSKIFLGTDSFTNNKKICFASALCLSGGKSPNRYFIYKDFCSSKKYKQLSLRVTEETRRSIEMAEILIYNYDIDVDNIEIHLDISPLHMNNGTSKFSEMLKGYVSGFGLECRLKPNAWASQSVADRHSK